MIRYTVAVVLLALTMGFPGCASLSGQHQQIAAACVSASSASRAITAGKEAGRVTDAQFEQAIAIYKTTVPVCEPVPAESLDAVKYAALSAAVAQLVAMQGALK